MLAYADNNSNIGKRRRNERIFKRLERYCEEKGLEVNTEKTKIIRFKKEGRGGSKIKWRWKRKELEEIKEISYLGYRLKGNGGQETHIKERERD